MSSNFCVDFLTLKVPEKLQLYGHYMYYVVHICDFGMLRVKDLQWRRWEVPVSCDQASLHLHPWAHSLGIKPTTSWFIEAIPVWVRLWFFFFTAAQTCIGYAVFIHVSERQKWYIIRIFNRPPKLLTRWRLVTSILLSLYSDILSYIWQFFLFHS